MSNKQKNAYIIGAGGQARVITSLLKKDFSKKYKIIEILSFDNNKFETDNQLKLKIKKLNFKEINISKNNHYFLAIGDISKRKKMFKKLISLGANLPNLISKEALIDKTSTMGIGNIILSFSKIGPYASIKDNNLINNFANIEHEVDIDSHSNFNPGCVVCGRVKANELCLIGANATVLENLKLKKGTVLGAGSVLLSDTITSNQILVGIPAKAKNK